MIISFTTILRTMETWLKERILHRYIIENYSKYRPQGLKILKVRDNKDQYPDLYCLLENNTEVPAEVEWKSSNFIQHDHDLNFLKENQGVLFVCEKDQDLGFDIPQIEIDIPHFESWFIDNASKIIQDTTEPYKRHEDNRKIPKLWFTYLSLKAGGVSDFDLALENETWGVQENYSPSVINQISTLQENDLVGFIGAGRGFPGRINLKTWMKKGFRGYFERIRVYRVTKGYFFDRTPIWKGKGKWKDESFPHRFKFDNRPIIDLRNVRISKLSLNSKQELHSMVYGNFISANPSTLVDIIYNSEISQVHES